MQTINYDAITKNAEYFKNKLGNTKLCAVLKNDAYGHGLVRTASVLTSLADFFAVGSVFEAIKAKPFAKDILILLPLLGDDSVLACEHGFVQTADSLQTLDNIIQSVPRGKKARVHVKIQSGMNRFGFCLNQIEQLAVALQSSKLSVEGVFSHFYGTTNGQCNKQLKVFLQACNFLENALSAKLIKHIANTAATQLGEKFFLDMARIGLGLYGYGAHNLLPAKIVSAKVLAVRNVTAGEKLGYGGKIVQQNTKIAVLGCGYANGFSRALKKPVVKLKNTVCPVVGNVCMAACMVDVGNLPVAVGDEAVVLGDGLNTCDKNIIVYELLCNLK